jgi:hypothetical protein
MISKHTHKPFHSSVVPQSSASGTLQNYNFTPMDAITDCVFLNMFSFTAKTPSKSDFHSEEGDR